MMNEFHTALYQMGLLYGIEMEEDDFDEYALIAWKKIGNHRARLYHLESEIDSTDLSIELPCNCEVIEAITTNWEDWSYTSNIYPNGNIDTSNIEQYIEARKCSQNPLYTRGHFVKYELVGDKIYFSRNYGKVHILYYGSVLDDEGLPELTDAEVDAIAAFVAYASKYKEGIQGNPTSLQLAQTLKADWNLKCDQARVPEYVNQNVMNEILDAKSCWNRKVYNRGFKPLM